MSRARLAVLAVLALLATLALPGAVAAADAVDIAGTVRTAEGAPAPGVEVLVGIAGTDIVQPATTDELGAFAVQVAAAPGDTIELRATGATVRSEPDAEGCVHATTPTGRMSLVLGETAPEPVELVLDTILESTVCTATATPEPKPRVTPPATDAGATRTQGAAPGLAVVLVVLAGAAAGFVVAGRSRRAA